MLAHLRVFRFYAGQYGVTLKGFRLSMIGFEFYFRKITAVDGMLPPFPTHTTHTQTKHIRLNLFLNMMVLGSGPLGDDWITRAEPSCMELVLFKNIYMFY